MTRPITGSMLYALVECPHRVSLDLFGDYEERDPVSAFVQLLWERGHAFEREVVQRLEVPCIDLTGYPDAERERLTLQAMARGEGLIYGARLRSGDLLGEPDLLRRQGSGYLAGDIKSGAGVEGGSEESEGKLKRHYGVQLALYTQILERLGFSGGRSPYIWDVHGEEVDYDLDAPLGVRNLDTMWDFYSACLAAARRIVRKDLRTRPALSATCKLCHWRTRCRRQIEALNDLTLIPELGRSRRDAMLEHVSSVTALAEADLNALIIGSKTVIPSVGAKMLRKFRERADLQTRAGAKPYLTEPLTLPPPDLELFFDVETDPMRDVCYLHGFVERRSGESNTERYVFFFAEEPLPEHEERAFGAAWRYIRERRPTAIYYYSPYERTTWRKLQDKYPHVASEEEIDNLFAPPTAVDLYHDVVRSKTEWPTHDYSIKTLAKYLGFTWRDTDPSGAASIEWYHRWVETGDEAIRHRILEYNHDDCVATRVLLDAVRGLDVR